jgi:hypothetical protein
MKKLISLFILSVCFARLFSQDSSTPSDTLRKDALNVFMSANDFIRKEIPYINYVRDIKDAGVYIISTRQVTGSGGVEYTYYLIGQNGNEGMRDTISFVSSPDETQEEIRIKEVKTLKMGFVRYIARTPLAKYLSVNFSEPLSQTVSTDKFNSWVYRTSVSGYINGQATSTQTSLNGNLSAVRITEDWKINLRARYNYGKNDFKIGDNLISVTNNSKSFNALIVRSISDHWSYGGSTFIASATYNNYSLSATVMPGIEYDLYPYSESTRRQLRFLYSIGYNYVSYVDTTIYNKINEGHLQHSFSASYAVLQKWGSVEVSLNYSNYMHDWSKNNLTIDSYLDLRITKGLSLNFGGSASLIHDQLGLAKGGATQEEVLLRVKEQATQFRYYTSFGFTFTFGSIYNNVVNPRFGQ